MNSQHTLSRRQLDGAIRVLCPLIEERLGGNPSGRLAEKQLRTELVACILGSQIRHEMAVASLQNLDHAGLLADSRWSYRTDHDFQSDVFDVLTYITPGLPHRCRYRFPKVRAAQIARTRDILARTPLAATLGQMTCPKQAREYLVAAIPGLGPKQASMFLRNIGESHNLAILDTHVLRFMDMQGLLPENHARVGTMVGYERVERIMIQYADTLGYPAGYMDWAIWATMKAVQELRL